MIRPLVLLTCFGLASAQIGEIASVVTGLLSGAGPAASGAAGAAGALGSIGTLYQLAQTALQLTGTGVGILNQASEGKWFNDLASNVVANQRELQDRLLSQGAAPGQIPLTSSALLPSSASGGNGLNSFGGGTSGFGFGGSHGSSGGAEELLGSEVTQLGKNFPAPEPEDYEEEKRPEPESLIRIDETALTLPEITTTPQSRITLFPEETVDKVEVPIRKTDDKKEELTAAKKAPHRTEDEYYDEVKKELEEEFVTDKEPISEIVNKEERIGGMQNDTDKPPTAKKAPNLMMLVDIIRNSRLSENDMHELIKQIENNKNTGTPVSQTTLSPPQPVTSKTINVAPHPLRVVSTGNRLSRMHQQKPLTYGSGEDSDLLGIRHIKIENAVRAVPNVELEKDRLPPIPKHYTVSPPKSTKYPRRTMPPPVPRAVQPQEIVPLNPPPQPSNTNAFLNPQASFGSMNLPGQNIQPVQQSVQFPQQHQGFINPATIQPWYPPANLWTPAPANLWTPAPAQNFFTFPPQNPPQIFSTPPNLFVQQAPTPPPTPAPVRYSAPQAHPMPSAPVSQYPSYYAPQNAQPYLYGQMIQRFQPQSIPQFYGYQSA